MGRRAKTRGEALVEAVFGEPVCDDVVLAKWFEVQEVYVIVLVPFYPYPVYCDWNRCDLPPEVCQEVEVSILW